MMSSGLMSGASQRLKKFEQNRRPWIAVTVTIVVLCLLIYAGNLDTDDVKQEGSHEVKSKSDQKEAASTEDSGSSSNNAGESGSGGGKSDEASLMSRLSECKIPDDVPDPYKTRKASDDPKFTETGAWELPENYDYYLDEALAQSLVCLFQNDWVLELGAGVGHYTKFLLASDKLKGIRAYDGIKNVEEKSNGLVKHADLTRKREFGGPFDWVLTLEVAAHIPKEFEETFLDNIHRHAK